MPSESIKVQYANAGDLPVDYIRAELKELASDKGYHLLKEQGVKAGVHYAIYEK